MRERLSRQERLYRDILEDPPPMPATRGDCLRACRPCFHVACRHHLYLDVTRVGSLKINFPDLEAWELQETCSLDVAERRALNLEEVGDIMNLTRERVRQLEVRGLAKMKAALDASEAEAATPAPGGARSFWDPAKEPKVF